MKLDKEHRPRLIKPLPQQGKTYRIKKGTIRPLIVDSIEINSKKSSNKGFFKKMGAGIKRTGQVIVDNKKTIAKAVTAFAAGVVIAVGSRGCAKTVSTIENSQKTILELRQELKLSNEEMSRMKTEVEQAVEDAMSAKSKIVELNEEVNKLEAEVEKAGTSQANKTSDVASSSTQTKQNTGQSSTTKNNNTSSAKSSNTSSSKTTTPSVTKLTKIDLNAPAKQAGIVEDKLLKLSVKRYSNFDDSLKFDKNYNELPIISSIIRSENKEYFKKVLTVELNDATSVSDIEKTLGEMKYSKVKTVGNETAYRDNVGNFAIVKPIENGKFIEFIPHANLNENIKYLNYKMRQGDSTYNKDLLNDMDQFLTDRLQTATDENLKTALNKAKESIGRINKKPETMKTEMEDMKKYLYPALDGQPIPASTVKTEVPTTTTPKKDTATNTSSTSTKTDTSSGNSNTNTKTDSSGSSGTSTKTDTPKEPVGLTKIELADEAVKAGVNANTLTSKLSIAKYSNLNDSLKIDKNYSEFAITSNVINSANKDYYKFVLSLELNKNTTQDAVNCALNDMKYSKVKTVGNETAYKDNLGNFAMVRTSDSGTIIKFAPHANLNENIKYLNYKMRQGDSTYNKDLLNDMDQFLTDRLQTATDENLKTALNKAKESIGRINNKPETMKTEMEDMKKYLYPALDGQPIPVSATKVEVPTAPVGNAVDNTANNVVENVPKTETTTPAAVNTSATANQNTTAGTPITQTNNGNVDPSTVDKGTAVTPCPDTKQGTSTVADAAPANQQTPSSKTEPQNETPAGKTPECDAKQESSAQQPTTDNKSEVNPQQPKTVPLHPIENGKQAFTDEKGKLYIVDGNSVYVNGQPQELKSLENGRKAFVDNDGKLILIDGDNVHITQGNQSSTQANKTNEQPAPQVNKEIDNSSKSQNQVQSETPASKTNEPAAVQSAPVADKASNAETPVNKTSEQSAAQTGKEPDKSSQQQTQPANETKVDKTVEKPVSSETKESDNSSKTQTQPIKETPVNKTNEQPANKTTQESSSSQVNKETDKSSKTQTQSVDQASSSVNKAQTKAAQPTSVEVHNLENGRQAFTDKNGKLYTMFDNVAYVDGQKKEIKTIENGRKVFVGIDGKLITINGNTAYING